MTNLISPENIDMFLKHGWLFPLALFLLILLVYGKTIFPAFITWINDLKNVRIKKKDKSIFLSHAFFYNTNTFLTVKIPAFNFKGDLGRTKIFKDMVSIHLTVFVEKIRELVKSDITMENVLTLFSNAIISCKKEQEILWKSEGIPSAVIHKFNEWNSSKLEHLLQSVKDAANTKIIDSLHEKIYIIMNDCENYAYSVCFDGEKTLISLNGELDGIEYKGSILGVINHK